MTKTTKTTTTRRLPRRAKAAPAAAGSVVPKKYRDRYKDGSCGDEVALKLKERCAGANGTFDPAKLKAIAEANGVWQGKYSQFNPGMQRLNIGNRLRALAKRQQLKWGRGS